MSYIDQKKYYTNDGVNPTNLNWGSYQFVTLSDIVKNLPIVTGKQEIEVKEEKKKKK